MAGGKLSYFEGNYLSYANSSPASYFFIIHWSRRQTNLFRTQLPVRIPILPPQIWAACKSGCRHKCHFENGPSGSRGNISSLIIKYSKPNRSDAPRWDIFHVAYRTLFSTWTWNSLNYSACACMWRLIYWLTFLNHCLLLAARFPWRWVYVGRGFEGRLAVSGTRLRHNGRTVWIFKGKRKIWEKRTRRGSPGDR